MFSYGHIVCLMTVNDNKIMCECRRWNWLCIFGGRRYTKPTHTYHMMPNFVRERKIPTALFVWHVNCCNSWEIWPRLFYSRSGILRWQEVKYFSLCASQVRSISIFLNPCFVFLQGTFAAPVEVDMPREAMPVLRNMLPLSRRERIVRTVMIVIAVVRFSRVDFLRALC